MKVEGNCLNSGANRYHHFYFPKRGKSNEFRPENNFSLDKNQGRFMFHPNGSFFDDT